MKDVAGVRVWQAREDGSEGGDGSRARAGYSDNHRLSGLRATTARQTHRRARAVAASGLFKACAGFADEHG